MDVAQGRTAQTYSSCHIAEAAVHQNDIRTVNGNIGPGANGDADIGTGQRRGVVDAVADHGNQPALLKLPDNGFFPVREHVCYHAVNSGLRADGFGSAFVVPRQHTDLNAHILKRRNRFRRVIFHDVGHSYDAEEAFIFGKEQRGFPLSCQRRGGALSRGGKLEQALQVAEIPAVQIPAAACCRQPVSGQRTKAADFVSRHIPALGFSHNCPGKRMLTFCLQRVGRLQEFILTAAIRREKIRHPRFACGNGACLVQGNDLYLPCGFQRFAGFEENAVFGTDAVADHNGNRRCKPQRAGAGNDQNRDAPRKGKAQALAVQQPAKNDHSRNADHCRHKHTRNAVSNARDRRLGCRRIRDHADDLAESGILTDPGCTAADEAGSVHGGGTDSVAFCLVHRDAFACQGRFVDGAVSFQYHAVHRDALSRTHHEYVSRAHFVNGHFHLGAVPQQDSRFRRQLHQALQRIGRTAFGHGFQHLADGNQGRDHRSRFKIKLIVVKIHQLRVVRALSDHAAHFVKDEKAPAETDRGTKCHERIHIRSAVYQRPKSAGEKLAVDKHHNKRQQHLRQGQCQMIVLKPYRQRPVPHVMAHGDVHQHQQEADRQRQAALQFRSLMILKSLFLRRETAASSLLFRRALQAGAVAGLFHRADDRFIRYGTFNAHGVGQEADTACADTGHAGNGLFHPGLTCCTAHAGYNILLQSVSSFLSACR